tara:strand:+ start:1050 stop:1766 length:717 start_codon:yes stop_codon:yes gene_type:complete
MAPYKKITILSFVLLFYCFEAFSGPHKQNNINMSSSWVQITNTLPMWVHKNSASSMWVQKVNNKLLSVSGKGVLTDNEDIPSIVIDISEQRLYLLKNTRIIKSFPISSSKYGEGSTQNSFKTPLGIHVIKDKIGYDVPKNTIFKSRINTNRPAEIIQSPFDTEDDHVTSRILWLDGTEYGKNKGKGIDSYDRYIYIHGTHEEGLIGTKASHGCIRMFNDDVINLFSEVTEGTYVLIKA